MKICRMMSPHLSIEQNIQLIIPGFQRTLVAVERTLTAL